MAGSYTAPLYPYQRSADQARWLAQGQGGEAARHPLVIIGAGPVGLTLALDCAARGLPVLLLDDNNRVSEGSRAVCYAKRSLEILDRLGVAPALLARGVRWQVGKVFHGQGLAYRFDLLPEAHHKLPAMINLQQYHLEEALVAACQAQPRIDLRWRHQVVAQREASGDEPAGVQLTVRTPDGDFPLWADWVVACDGARSQTRERMGLGFEGQAFQDRFLIADVRLSPRAPATDPTASATAAQGLGHGLGQLPERWFWFDPPFHPGQSVLLHQQADQVWRIDFQLGWEADPEHEKQPERVLPRIRAMLGPAWNIELEWVSVYQFACRRMARFRHGRVLFAGDAAHQVSPFGARGANSGIQDAENLAWKLAAVWQGEADDALLDSYDQERTAAADANIGHSSRATDFITPKSGVSRLLRDAVLQLAREQPFARPLVNSGRLSTATPYPDSRLNTPDPQPCAQPFDSPLAPGTVCADAPLRRQGRPAWLLETLGQGFVLLGFGEPQALQAALQGLDLPGLAMLLQGRDFEDSEGLLARRYDARPGTCYLIRPDQHVAGRWRRPHPAAIAQAWRRALGRPEEA